MIKHLNGHTRKPFPPRSSPAWPVLIRGLALTLALATLGQRAMAATNNWVHAGGSSSWFAPGNWSGGVPAAGDTVFVSKEDTTAFVEGPTAARAGNLFIDSGGVTIGNLDPGTLIVDGELSVGAAGASGKLSLDYGTLSVNTLTVGSSGSYTDTAFSTLNLTGTDPTIRMANGITVNVKSLVTGTNGLRKAGLGTLVLENDNTYSGGTTISAGTLQVGNGGTSGSLGSGDVVNNGSLVFNRSDDILVDNLISGSGNLKHVGAGRLTVTADNTYGGGTTITGGTLQVGDGGTTGSLGSGNITNNGALAYNRSDDITVSNRISGTGSLTQKGSGKLTVTANNTYSGGTVIEDGILQVGNGGTNGSLGSGVISNNATLAFNRSDSVTVSNRITGSGELRQEGSGTTILTSDNNYSGLTTISNGTLQVGNGGGTGSLGTNAVHNYGSLVFNRSNAVTVNNEISGTGNLKQIGTNTLTITGTNTYSGGTWIENGGTIVVRNDQALGSGDVNVVNGTLKASPTSTNRISLKIGGDYNQSAEGTLELAIGGTQSNRFDQLKITGEANLDGTLRLTAADGYRAKASDQHQILTADGGVSGTYSALSNLVTHSDLLEATLLYHTNDVTLKWQQLSFNNYLEDKDIALTHNQSAVAKGLDGILNSTASNNVALLDYLDYLGNLTNDLPVAFDQIAPEELTALLVVAFSGLEAQGQQFMKRANELRADYRRFYTEALSQRAQSPQALEAYLDRPWNWYFDPSFDFADVKGDANADGYSISRIGMTAGADRRLGKSLFVGGAVGYSTATADLSGGGDLDVSTFSAQAYATWYNGGFHLEGMLGAAFNSFDSKRVAVQGIAKGSSDGIGWTGLIGGGYDWENGPWKFGPQLALQYSSASVDEFTETGSLSPLRIESQDETSLYSQLGGNLRYRHHIADSWTVITPEIYFGWRHQLMDDQYSLEASFPDATNGHFTVDGPAMGTDSVIVSLGVSVQWQPNVNTYFNFTTEMGRSGYDAQNINLGVRVSF